MQIRIKRIDKGTLKEEKVVLEILENCNMGHFLIFNTTSEEKGVKSNKDRKIYAFASLDVHKDDFVVLHTRKGTKEDQSVFSNKRGTKTYNLFWGLEDTLWKNTGDKVFIIHYDSWVSKTAE